MKGSMIVRRVKQFIAFMSIGAVLTISCASFSHQNKANPSELSLVVDNSKEFSDEDIDVPLRTDTSLSLILPDFRPRGISSRETISDWLIEHNFYSSGTSIAADYNETDIDSFIDMYLKNRRYGLVQGVKRAIQNASVTIPVFRERSIPLDFIFLPIIESGYNPELFSSKGAAGIWQFMPGTANNLGLKVKHNLDERRDILKSAAAAADYISSLYERFSDWSLVVAAYNVGEARIEKLVKEYRKTHGGQRVTFWDIKDELPAETRNYVPRFFAILKILHSPDAYGVTEFDTVELNDQTDTLVAIPLKMEKDMTISQLSAMAGLSRFAFRRYNPQFTSDRVYKGDTITLYLPMLNARYLRDNLMQQSEAFAVDLLMPQPEPSEGAGTEYSDESSGLKAYVVKSDESIGDIASKFGVSVKDIKRINGLTTDRLHEGQVLLIPTEKGVAVQ